MRTLTKSKQQSLIDELRRFEAVYRYVSERSWDRLALELGVSKPTLMSACRNGYQEGVGRPGKLTEAQIAWARNKRAEIADVESERKYYRQSEIADRLDLPTTTVERYRIYLMSPHKLPMTRED